MRNSASASHMSRSTRSSRARPSKRWKHCGRKRRLMMPIEVRALSAHADLEEAVRLQQEIWGFEEIELLPLRLFVGGTKVGGQAFGAFDGKRMVGFCLAIPGMKPPKPNRDREGVGDLHNRDREGVGYLHSHMLGVLPEYQNHGVVRKLKLPQRDDALERSIELIE